MSTSNNKVLRIIYAGTPEFAVPALQALIDSEHEIVAVYTQPDRRAGRGQKIRLSAVKQLALDTQLPIEQTTTLKSKEALKTLKAYQADIMIVAAYGLLLPQAILDAPRYGCLNIHGSLLPRWRGAAPIQRAIEAGDQQTGVTIMQMALGLDTGDMLSTITCPITATDTAQTLHDQLANDGATALLATLEQLVSGTLNPEQQDESKSCYAHKLSKQEAEIDWHQSAIEIDRRIRAFNPWPVAYTLKEGKPLRLYNTSVIPSTQIAPAGSVIAESKQGIEIATQDGSVLITRLQLPNNKALEVKDFLNGRSLAAQVFPS